MTTSTSTFKVGDRVTPRVAEGVPAECLGRTFVVRKVNPKNLKCDAEDGGRGINFPAAMLLPATDELAAKSAATAELVPIVSREYFTMGEIVTLKRPWKDVTTETPLVVLVDKGNKVNVTRLGGDGDRYVRVPPAGLVKRDRAWLAETLVESVTA